MQDTRRYTIAERLKEMLHQVFALSIEVPLHTDVSGLKKALEDARNAAILISVATKDEDNFKAQLTTIRRLRRLERKKRSTK